MKSDRIRHMTRAALLAASVVLGASLAQSAPPLVNTPIGNQAKATYTDDSNVVREVFSNTVVTRVSQIYALDLQQDNTRLATPGSQVFFPHTITNLGNGDDTITLGAVNAGTTSLTSLAIYADANQDGLPDNFTALTVTPSLAAGAEFHFVVVGVVPPAATTAAAISVTVTATSQGNATATDTNTDTVTVTNDAVLQVNKAIDTPAGIPGTAPVKYTITYTNTGNTAATNFTIQDAIPTGMTYVAGSARWSVTGTATILTDTNSDGSQSGITYDFGGTTAGRATFVVATVAPGQSGFVTFEVGVNNGIAPQVIPNTAIYSFTSNGAKGPFNSNTVPFTVIQVANVNLDGDTTPENNSGANYAGGIVPAGSIAVFHNVLTNTGTGTDTFDITLSGSDFPTGTTFQLFQSDGNTPMTDSNGNGVPDTGPVAPGATYTVVLKANIPGDATGASTGRSVTKTARSGFNPTVSDTGLDTIAGITVAGVDLTNNASITGGGLGVGQNSNDGNTTNIVVNNTNPGTTTTFTLVVNNTGPNPDSFNLLADDDLTFGTVSDLPAGWSVVFKNASGTVVSNTGVIASGSSATITAEITVPAGNAPGAVPIYFRALSPVSNAFDIIRDAVSVNTIRNLSFQIDQVGQTFPGGSVVYTHTLTNRGNVAEGNTSPSIVTFTHVDTLAGSGFTSVIHYDLNGDGNLDAGDPVIVGALGAVKGAGIAPGESVTVFVKVFAPLGAADGAADATTVTVTTTGGAINGTAVPATVVNVDTTNVVRGDLTVVKEQAIDDNADGVIDQPYTVNQRNAPPGAVILYRITVLNAGSANATGITVNDTIPANTRYLNAAPGIAATVTGSGTAKAVTSEPANGAVSPSALVFSVGTLAPNEFAVIDFSVRINQ